MVEKFLKRFRKKQVQENIGNILTTEEVSKETNILAVKIINLLTEFVHKTGRAYVTGVNIAYPNGLNDSAIVKVELNVHMEKENFVEPLSIEIPDNRRVVN